MRADVARLKWRSRRGMRELDAVLQSFIEVSVDGLDPAELACFEQILDLSDPELLAYLTGRSAPANPDIERLIEQIRASHRPRA
jgi:antitoxin CptB